MVGRIPESVGGLHNFREFSQPRLLTSVFVEAKVRYCFYKIFLRYNYEHKRRIFTTVLPSSKHTYRSMRARHYLKYSLIKDN